MSPDREVVFATPRLLIRFATIEDVDLFHQLWTDPRVMSYVGFPEGLPMTREQIHDRIAASGGSEFDRLLVIELKSTGQAVGECWMSRPNAEGVATTDVKLLRAFWGNKYGVEVERGLLEHLFAHTDTVAVEVTPHVNNAASIKMHEAVSGVRVGEGIHQFPESMCHCTTPVPHYVYRVSRVTWQTAR
jgi:RimJ/RimL family protein N-acetyltransferase